MYGAVLWDGGGWSCTGIQKRAVDVRELKEMRRGRGFYEGRSSSKAITCPWCLFNVDLIKSADDIKLGEQLTCLKAGLLFRGLQTGTSWNPARTNTSSCPGKEECWQICGVGPDRFGSNSAEKGLWVLVGSNINMCQSCTLALTQWTASWTALIACRLREVITLLYLALTSPHPEYSIPFSGWDENFAWREDIDELKQVLCLWKLKHMLPKLIGRGGAEGGVGLFSLKTAFWGDLLIHKRFLSKRQRQALHSDAWWADGTWKESSRQGIRKIFVTIRWVKQWASAASVLGSLQDPSGQTALNSLVWPQRRPCFELNWSRDHLSSLSAWVALWL